MIESILLTLISALLLWQAYDQFRRRNAVPAGTLLYAEWKALQRQLHKTDCLFSLAIGLCAVVLLSRLIRRQ